MRVRRTILGIILAHKIIFPDYKIEDENGIQQVIHHNRIKEFKSQKDQCTTDKPQENIIMQDYFDNQNPRKPDSN